MNALMIVLSLTFQPASDAQEITAVWQEQAASLPSAEIQFMVEHDSRHRTFGQTLEPKDRPVVRLRFNPELLRFDGPRWTAMRRDGRTQPAEADPDRARIEFRNVLLEEQLAGPQRTPTIEPASLIVHNDGGETGDRLSQLDRLLAEAPLWSSQPLRFMDARQWKRGTDVVGGPRLIAAEDDREIEVWTTSSAPFRPVRIIKRQKKRGLWQIDLAYSPDEPRLASRYEIQTIGVAGETLEFMTASLGSVTSPLPPSSAAGIARIESPQRDQPGPFNPSRHQLRSRIRSALDSDWLPAAIICICALLILRRRPAPEKRGAAHS